MERPDWKSPLDAAAAHALRYLEGLPDRPVRPALTTDVLRAALARPLPDGPTDAREVIDALAAQAEPGAIANSSGRFFGFVIGGALPAALAADWLTSTWDQNHGLAAAGPAASVLEEIALGWLIDLFGLPPHASGAFVTGTQMAHVTCLLVARHRVLADAGWDVEAKGLIGAPPVRILLGQDAHVTVHRALRFIGLGAETATVVPADGQGRMDVTALAEQLTAADGPTIVVAQAGDVNTGAFDPLEPICEAAHRAGAWVHVDGAFGLWAAATPARRALVEGVELADSWTTDCHKWLNVPYDCGIAFTAHPADHRAALGTRASYLIQSEGAERDPVDWTPEFSRRARATPAYAALASLGRSGVADLVDRCCDHARRFAELLAADPAVEIGNDVVLNQVLVRFLDPSGDHDALTRDTVTRVQADGTCWVSGTNRRGHDYMRISVVNWSTTEEDVDLSVAAMLRCADAARAAATGEQ